MLVINCKNYMEVSGSGMENLMGAIRAASKAHGAKIAIAPPIHMAGMLAGLEIPIISQHADNASVGGTTGFVIPEMLKASGVAGSLINHSERRISPENIRSLVPRLQKLGMISIVCARDAAEAGQYAELGPDYVAVEPPELIGSGRSVSTHRPELISRASQAVRDAGGRSRLLCGAGIVSGDDVARAMELGSEGILVASGIVKADNWKSKISEFASAMSRCSCQS